MSDFDRLRHGSGVHRGRLANRVHPLGRAAVGPAAPPMGPAAPPMGPAASPVDPDASPMGTAPGSAALIDASCCNRPSSSIVSAFTCAGGAPVGAPEREHAVEKTRLPPTANKARTVTKTHRMTPNGVRASAGTARAPGVHGAPCAAGPRRAALRAGAGPEPGRSRAGPEPEPEPEQGRAGSGRVGPGRAGRVRSRVGPAGAEPHRIPCQVHQHAATQVRAMGALHGAAAAHRHAGGRRRSSASWSGSPRTGCAPFATRATRTSRCSVRSSQLGAGRRGARRRPARCNDRAAEPQLRGGARCAPRIADVVMRQIVRR